MELKTILSSIAILLTFVGYIPYIRDTIKGKTKPHVYSWFIWGFVTLIIFGLQITEGAGSSSFITLAAAIISLLIFVLGLKSGKKIIVTSDKVFLVLSLVSIGIWLIADQPIISIILLSTIETLGFIPTIRKSWNDPYSETLFTYILNTFRHVLSYLAIKDYNIVTYLYPITWIAINGLFALLLIIRRIQVNKK